MPSGGAPVPAAAKAAAEAAEAEMEAAWSELEAALGLKESIDLEQALSMLAQSQADNAAKDTELAELRARLASHGDVAEGVPPE